MRKPIWLTNVYIGILSLVIRESHIKVTVGYPLNFFNWKKIKSEIPNVGKDVE